MSSSTVESRYTLLTTHMELTSLESEVKKGLCLAEKRLPFWLLYDTKGSEIYEDITEVEEYYPTRCEAEILTARAEEIVSQLAPNTLLVELGSGSSVKTRILLDAFTRKFKTCHYVPIDISRDMLDQSCQDLTKDYPDLRVTAVNGLYQQGLQEVHNKFQTEPKLVMFLGSSIGNFDRTEASQFLREMRLGMREQDKFLVGIDLKKSSKILEAAYDDSKGVTAAFNLNLLNRINRECGANFVREKFHHQAKWNENPGHIEMRLVSNERQKVTLSKLQTEVEFNTGDSILTECCHKYTKVEIETLAGSASFYVTDQWTDTQNRFSLSIFTPINAETAVKPEDLVNGLKQGWVLIDIMFNKLLTQEAWLQRPIALRHPFIFYHGHSNSFAHNQVCNYIFKRNPSFNPGFDDLFERGIDPNVMDPSKCHSHSCSAELNKWPSHQEMMNYKEKVHQLLIDSVPHVLEMKENMMAQKGRVYQMCFEHDVMHFETLLYMYLNLDDKYKQQPEKEVKNYIFGKSKVAANQAIKIPSGQVTLGRQFHEGGFGWDNEFPAQVVQVDEFEMDALPVTNREFMDFVKAGGYSNRNLWDETPWEWQQKIKLTKPNSWELVNDKWFVRTVFDLVPMEDASDWPVLCSQSEAAAYARWKGKSLPTEAQYFRAAYGAPSGKLADQRPHPWGSDAPTGGVHGNFDLFSWAPTPVGHFPQGASAFGIFDLIGNGWEWTSTVFNGLEGFERTIPKYQGYSADFFDNEHWVMLGGSWATGKPLIRRSFRNWFQRVYPYMFSKFRLVQNLKTN